MQNLSLMPTKWEMQRWRFVVQKEKRTNGRAHWITRRGQGTDRCTSSRTCMDPIGKKSRNANSFSFSRTCRLKAHHLKRNLPPDVAADDGADTLVLQPGRQLPHHLPRLLHWQYRRCGQLWKLGLGWPQQHWHQRRARTRARSTAAPKPRISAPAPGLPPGMRLCLVPRPPLGDASMPAPPRPCFRSCV